MSNGNENAPNRYKTGDLLLLNRWTVASILTHATDQTTRWSDVGMFIVNSSQPASINVMLLTTDGLIIEELNDLLRNPTVQAAAHRSLNVNGKTSASRFIIEYLKVLAEHQDRIKAIYPEQYSLGSTKSVFSSNGSRLDSKGRDVKVSGFIKGDPNSKLKSEFTPTDLIGSILSHAGLLKYDPDIRIADFQAGEGLLDDYYSEETPLLPNHKLDEDDIEEVLLKARAEAELLVLAQLQKFPLMTYKRLVSQPKGSSNNQNFNKADEDEILRYVTAYPEQESNPMSMAGIYNRKLDTNLRAEDAESTSIDKKIRQKQKAMEQYARPIAKYK